MLLKALPLLLTIGTALAIMPLRPRIFADRTLLDFMIDANGAGTTNPALQQYCFNRYLPVLKDITDEYERNYKVCTDEYQLESAKIDAVFKGPYENITSTARNTCESLQQCDGRKEYADAFDCYSSTGSDQAKELLKMSGYASENSVQIKDNYRIVDNVAQACVSKAETTYWENTINTQGELSKCLNGDIVEPATTKRPTDRPN